MTKEQEQICINAVSQILRDHYGDDYFSIGRPKECAACLDGAGNSWRVYCVERGNEFDVKTHHNVVDACVDLVVRIGINDGPEDLIDQFYSLIIEGGDALTLQFDCERYEASLARTGESVSLEAVENISMRCDARALAEYAKQKGVSTLDLSDQERMMFWKRKAYFESQVRNLKIIMAGLGVSAEQAMDLLKVPEEERARHKAAIEDAKE